MNTCFTARWPDSDKCTHWKVLLVAPKKVPDIHGALAISAPSSKGSWLKFKSISYTFQSELNSSNDDLFLSPIITIATIVIAIIIIIIKANSCEEV